MSRVPWTATVVGEELFDPSSGASDGTVVIGGAAVVLVLLVVMLVVVEPEGSAALDVDSSELDLVHAPARIVIVTITTIDAATTPLFTSGHPVQV